MDSQIHRIQNKNELARSSAHSTVLDIIEAALDAIDTELVMKQHVRLEGDNLFIAGHSFDLGHIENIYIVGFGKVSCKAAVALEKILKQHLTAGIVISNVEATCEVIATYHGSHPRPSPANVSASEKIVALSDLVTERDLVLTIVSGGGSALLCWPASECDQGKKLYDEIIRSEGTIHELNTVRKHLSKLKGGGLAKLLYPAQIVGLIFSDIPGGAYEMIASGPTYYDHSTTRDAEQVINKLSLGEYELYETPKDQKWFERVTNIPLVSNQQALTAMKTAGEALGYEVVIIGNDFLGEMYDITQQLLERASPGRIIIAGGEARLAIPKQVTPGNGGRNTHLALLMSQRLTPKQVFASFATDGIDNSRAAGAVVDGNTQNTLARSGLKSDQALAFFDSYTVLHAIGQTIMTGPTQTNISDLYILLTDNGEHSNKGLIQ